MPILGTVASQVPANFTPILPVTSNLFARYDASNSGSITLSGSNITQWNDISGNGKTATQSTSTSRPTLVASGLNGRNTISFDGNSDFFNISNTTVLSNNFTVYAVVKADFLNASTPGTTIVGSDDSGFTWYIQKNNRRLNLDKTLQASMLMSSNILDTSENNVWRQANVTWSGSSSGSQRWNKSGMGSFNRDPFAPTQPLKTIGSYAPGADYYMQGEIAEIIIYSVAHNSSTTESIEAYFSAKWGV
jgi:hypothetical protein